LKEIEEARMAAVSLTVNSKRLSVDVDPRTLLVQLLREDLRLTGTHVGCDTSQCGACVVLVNGKAVKSCTVLALQLDGADVLSIEGLAPAGGPLHPMQEAFRENHGLQCGYCTPGMIMTIIPFARSWKVIYVAAPATITSSRLLPPERVPCAVTTRCRNGIREPRELVAVANGKKHINHRASYMTTVRLGNLTGLETARRAKFTQSGHQ
jgi:carbon-monoxide dehydrogenase small subunit